MKITWHADKKYLSELKPYSKNPRTFTKKGMEDLGKSLDKFGLADPIIINTDAVVIGGHARLEALKQKNIKEKINVIIPNRKLSEKEIKELNIRLNKNIAGEFDFDILANEFELEDLLDWGFEEKELDINLWKDEIPEEKLDEVPEPQKEAYSKLGDIFLLDGKHRVMCGDSTNKAHVSDLCANKRVDMVFTDPPYGMFLNTDFTYMEGYAKGKKYKQVIGDHEDFKPELISTVFDNFKCKEIFLFGADYYAELIPKRNDGCFMVWDKTQGGTSFNTDYDKMFGSNFELVWSKNKHKRAIARFLWKGIQGLGKEDTKSRIHPTQKPVVMIVWFLEKFSLKQNEVIADIYLGSGSTLIACEQTNRICYGMEIDPIYIDVILRRYHNLYPDKKIECLTRDFDFNKLWQDQKNK